MPRDKTATHIRLMSAAREEFLEYGFEKASMRAIGERCGLTAAGIYRHCRDKEDLFDMLVSPAVEKIRAWQDVHVSRYSDAISSDEKVRWNDSWVDMMRDVVYPNMDDYHLLLARSQGTKYANFLHDMTEQSQEQFLSYLPFIREQGYTVWDVDAKQLHLLLSAYVTALFEPVIHFYSQEEALACLDIVEAFFIPGWRQLVGL